MGSKPLLKIGALLVGGMLLCGCNSPQRTPPPPTFPNGSMGANTMTSGNPYANASRPGMPTSGTGSFTGTGSGMPASGMPASSMPASGPGFSSPGFSSSQPPSGFNAPLTPNSVSPASTSGAQPFTPTPPSNFGTSNVPPAGGPALPPASPNWGNTPAGLGGSPR